MTNVAYSEIQETFGGTWKLDRSENFEEFLREVGVNVVIRKLAGLSKPVNEIAVKDNQISITLHTGVLTKCDTFELDKDFETDNQGQKSRCRASYSDGMLTIHEEPLNPKIKPTKSVRQLTADGEQLVLIYIGDVICKRWFKKIPG